MSSSEPLSSADRVALKRAIAAAQVAAMRRKTEEARSEAEKAMCNEISETNLGYIDHDRLEFYSGALEALDKVEIERPMKRSTKKNRKKQEPQTAGPEWYHLPRKTADLSLDAKFLEARGYADPKRFYKKTDPVSDFAQLGTVVPGPFDRSSDIIKKKHRRASFAAEVLADSGAKAYAKRKYNEIQAKRQPRPFRRSRLKDKFARKKSNLVAKHRRL
ncbi:hypothetical protein CTAYLR_008140 [Chrysophaeum taylorii]|uniref:Fcf2 pre-rRNA processing C-terminal domain-containing protein n=1 Tax=Chrysophaeum taylorii TaxID=2483200 RepID=A0AAD7XSM0_9STRA|nr:hypothetical protein CTAYLR_008140 [Chrysophaeum taylorii]